MATPVLPYPDMDFTPLDILTAAEMDQMVANDQYLRDFCAGLADGANLSDGVIQARNIDWSTLTGDELGWKYLGEAKLTAVADRISFVFPQQYQCYKVVFGGQMAPTTVAGAWLDFLWKNGSTTIKNSHQMVQFNNTSSPLLVTNTDVAYAGNAGVEGVNSYDGINIDAYSVKTDSSQWRKFQTHYHRCGNGISTILTNGRLSNITEPTGITIQTGGTFNVNTVLKVWGCDI